MADGGIFSDDTVTRRIDGALMVFQRLDGLWMIDRVGEVANDVDAWEHDEADERGDGERSEDLATAIARDEVVCLDAAARRIFHARQLRKLGLHPGGSGAEALWRIITDFDRFDPWVA